MKIEMENTGRIPNYKISFLLFAIIFTGVFLTILLNFVNNAEASKDLKTASFFNVPSRNSLSLKQAFLYALKHNKLIKIAKYKLQSSVYEENEAFSGFLPKINFNEIYMNTNNPLYAFGNILNQRDLTNQNTDYYFSPSFLDNPGMIQNYESNFQIEEPIFMGGKIYLGYKRAALNKDALKKNLTESQQKVLYDVAKAYYSADLALKYVHLMKNMVKTMRVYKDLTINLYKQGQVVSSDVLRAKVALASMKEKLMAADKNYRLALYYLNITAGIPINTEFTLSTDLKFKPFKKIISVKTLQSKAFKYRPDYKAMSLNKKNMALGITEAEGKFLPKISAAYNYYSNAPTFHPGDAYSYMFTVMFHFNIFSGMYDYNNLEKSKAAFNTAAEYKSLFKDKIEMQVRNAYLKYKTDLINTNVAKLAALNAKKTLKITKNRYDAGITTLINLDRTLDDYKQARLNYINSLYKLDLDKYYIKFVTGTI
ncbi:MAG: TolC family protein [Candidatus Acididesulfobacter guangdongensis]|uniref:TolC family protein n=1 Tax=Acididesulfobacter guangdongensis TaxID=2597225 RepID=A0A519BGK0_ACIG2|nr:MAG: TolC family protein [Candidatus Acididesulfobacter guangdongensis]